MSYMRGRHYLWQDDTHLHLWVADGHDGWDDSVWAENQRSVTGSGVGVALEIVDDFVVMRLAELLDSGALPDVIDRAVSRYRGNGGCIALEKRAPEIKTVLGAFPSG